MRTVAAAAVVACGMAASVRRVHAGPAEEELYDDTHVITLKASDLLSDVDSLPTPMLVDFFACVLPDQRAVDVIWVTKPIAAHPRSPLVQRRLSAKLSAGVPFACRPWCGACKHLAPAYARAADMVRAEGGGMTLAKFDATSDELIARRYGGSGYPTLVLFNKDGTKHNLKTLGPHNDAWIATWLRRRVTGSATQRLASLSDVAEFRAIAEVVCVLFSDSDRDADPQTAVFEDVANRWEDPTLRWAIAPAALQSHFSPHWRSPAVALFRQTGDITAAMDTPGWDETKLVNFVQQKDVPYLIRRIVLLNSWTHFVVLLGERLAEDHNHPYRQVYDFAAKDQEIVYESNLISTRDACNWILAAGGSDQKMDLKQPTAAYISVEKGVVKHVELCVCTLYLSKQCVPRRACLHLRCHWTDPDCCRCYACCRYGKPLIDDGLTIGSKSEPGTATLALAEWSKQFGPTGTLNGKLPPKRTEERKSKKKHVHPKTQVGKAEVPEASNGVGAVGQQSTTSKKIHATKQKTWHATVNSIEDPQERAHAEAKYAEFDEQQEEKKKKDEL